MLRTSYSQILNSSRDFSLAICDTRGRLIAQADHIPVHVGALPWATLAVEERFKDVAAGRRHPAQRSLSRRQPSAGPDRLRAGLRRRAAAALDHRARASERYRRRHPWRLQSRRHRDLAGGPARPADQALRGRQAARRPARSAGAERPQPARFPRRSGGDDRRGASRRAAAVAAVRRIRRAGRRSRGRGDPRCRRAADPRGHLDLEGRRVLRRGLSRRRRPRPQRHPDRRQGDQAGQRHRGRSVRLRSADRPASSIPRMPTCRRRWRWRSPI